MPYHTLNTMPSTALIISLIAFPGLSGSYVYRKLRGGNRFRASWQILFEVLCYAIIGYAVCILLLSVASIPWNPAATHWLRNSTNILQTIIPDANPPGSPIQLSQIAFLLIFTTILSMGFAFLASYIHHKNWLNKLGIKIGVSNRIGDEDVWESFLEHIPYVIVRDAKTNRTYYGILSNMSESDQPRELALEQVKVLDNDGTPLYNLKKIYLSRAAEDITLEFDPSPL